MGFDDVLKIDDPAVYGNTEWVSVLIHGQSFMLHQASTHLSAPNG